MSAAKNSSLFARLTLALKANRLALVTMIHMLQSVVPEYSPEKAAV
jgi:hypothetical protein